MTKETAAISGSMQICHTIQNSCVCQNQNANRTVCKETAAAAAVLKRSSVINIQLY